MPQPTAMIFDVKRFAVHDGPGVRTTLFLKGCPLHCLWCHNPESIAPSPQLGYYAHKCIDCSECAKVCPTHAHTMMGGKHRFDRAKCQACGLCESVCLGGALRLYGQTVTLPEALGLVLADRDFYGDTGGVTLSGGEPLLQSGFCRELLKQLKAANIHTAVDTCLYVKWPVIEEVRPFTDLFLVDLKHLDSARHRQLTGRGNELILDNLRQLAATGAGIEIRIPLIPGGNDDDANLLASGKLLDELHIKNVRLLPYHEMARSKYAALAMPDTMPQAELGRNMEHYTRLLRQFGLTIQ